MTPDATNPNGTSLPRLVLVVALLCGVGAIAVHLGHRLASSAVVDLGPTDERYVRDFREIERDGPVYFRWSSVPSSTLSVPVRFCGPGAVRLRARRHFLDPASMSVSMAGNLLGQRSIQARVDHPYEVIEFPVSKAICTSAASVLLEATVDNDRPLGIAVDWVELRSTSGFGASSGALIRGALFLGLGAIGLWLAGSGLGLILGVSGAVAVLVAALFAANPLAGERILGGGLVALFLTLLASLILGRGSVVRGLSAQHRSLIGVIILATLLSRLAFLHPQAFYPDYRVHALVQQTFNNVGLAAFLDQLFEIQYARSLGLQQVDGNWYPFPYPPGSYALTAAVAWVFQLSPLDASLAAAVTAASLIPLLTLAIGLALGFGESVSLAGAFFIALQPLLVRRLALGYFPGLAGQLADALAMLFFVAVLRASGSRARPTMALTLLMLAAFLVYTQSIANFGLLIAALLLLELVRPTEGGRRGALGVALAGILALAGAAGLFYSRYLPVAENISSHRPQPESRVLDRLERLRQNAPETESAPEADDLNDPFSGTTVNPARGLARLGSRLWRFNGPFALAILVGLGLLWRSTARPGQNLILAWSSVALGISLLAAGLPSPNGFQHLKDLEFVSPLFALAAGSLTARLWEWRRAAAATFAFAWLIFAGLAYSAELRDRLLSLADF